MGTGGLTHASITVDPMKSDVWTYQPSTLVWSPFVDAPGDVNTGTQELRMGRTNQSWGSLLISGGSDLVTPVAVLGSDHASGTAVTSDGDVVVDGPGSLFAPTRLTLGDYARVQIVPSINVDSISFGRVTVQNGGSLVSDIVESDGSGSITVTGIGSSATITGRTNLWGHTMTVNQGASASAREIRVGSLRTIPDTLQTVGVSGNLSIDGVGSHLSTPDPLRVVVGALEIRNGATISVPSVRLGSGTAYEFNPQLRVSGQNTVVTIPTVTGAGNLAVSDGGRLVVNSHPDNGGSASGQGSSISINGALNLRSAGSSTISFNISAGASVDCLSSSMGEYSELLVRNPGSTWSVDGPLTLSGRTVFADGFNRVRNGILDIRDGATVTADTLEVLNYGRLEYDLTPNSLISAHPQAALQVQGLVDLDQVNTPIVVTRSSFTLNPNHAFHILS